MRIQTRLEEQLNTWTHGFGALLGIIALILLITNVDDSKPWHLFSVIIYGASIVILFMASSIYHAVEGETYKHNFRIVDHISIYFLIAGTYTPVLLICLTDSLGWPLFWTVWGIASFGVILKLFFTGRFEIASTLLYLVMGWLIVLDLSNVSEALGSGGMLWLSAGGLFYTVGIIFYIIERIPYNHVIWHLFVLGGAISHFFMIYYYVL
ncbi:PAQR family membrane homeostasis protein TrhA [Winogradskyella bathintestinalis]|uniref:Hemolysin III family protein n=1 Tax=Winogradskyella bathintestinalis TaxID=3035208 RepID=A0ABT7ZVX9_9FLAO|nr:hemolysin III family protein [Winogradskyella bathintestinalis]MDN3493167.1 hemolysin III family protein [Winogradskyella bathintestinalis]